MDIRDMKAGRKLDKIVGVAIGATPKIMWYAMDKEESSYYMDFELKGLAEAWHNGMVVRFPDGGYVEDGGHIVRTEIYRRYSEDISAAWEAFIKMGMPAYLNKSYLKTFGVGEIGWRVNWCKDQGCDPTDICRHGNDIWELAAPLAIAKAALLQMEVS